jgi:hypothetical protein
MERPAWARRCSLRSRWCSYIYRTCWRARCFCCAWRPRSAKQRGARSHSAAGRISHSRLERRCLHLGGCQSCMRTPPSSSQADGSQLRPLVVAREPLVAKCLERALCGNKIEDKPGFISSTLSRSRAAGGATPAPVPAPHLATASAPALPILKSACCKSAHGLIARSYRG